MISKAYYLPYVDDSETPEQIMKKFEALEEIQKRKAEANSATSHSSGDRATEENKDHPEDE